ncbi:uncharacterized protein TRIADDRAFT_23547 [Trichoplax adhaerens]|uniref:F-actin-capping protein subunit alpha n=1 Tax=Trichoplax adhaerens TaxID=10228 RepID=B3RV08_TRIAD|nr:hypothetical protein TRIADDRAFT_23547 [Trichoplax adhaerens]EDV25918.1 hypothetical protein TRIADDRAFT_23547 [Trichoplax adhaerens]|eukprot:XP_002111951.1 hypothetical protein TRIADDRAFT_23547 [Trichoplax adhaerens]
MASDSFETPISDEEKANIASNFITHAPPGEFNEVLNDVRILLQNDSILKGASAESFASYNMEQFLPVKLDDSDDLVIVSKHGQIEDDRFIDPFQGRSFKLDHLRKEVTDIRDHDMDSQAEPYRKAVQEAIRGYIKSYYPHGVFSVFGNSDSDITIVICIEDHHYQAKNYWNGRWKSEWIVTIPSGGNFATVKGSIKVQVHYYEDGNVQLVTSKEHEDQVDVTTERGTADKLVKLIGSAEAAYQTSISENYNNMSDTAFKALRRQLPITRSKLDWNQILSYKIGKELKNA